MISKPAKVAIACQGGGTHTAFTAGVLRGILRSYRRREIEIVALSGTSGGAICAALAWIGLLRNDPEDGARRLAEFWAANAARSWWDGLLNHWGQAILAMGNYVAVPEVNPYRMELLRRLVPEPFASGLDAERRLRALINCYVPFDELPPGHAAAPRLLVGAVDVEQGAFRVFRSDAEPPEVSVDAILASAAVPTIFKAISVDDGFEVRRYWDGLFSQNPPIRDLTAGLPRDMKPDEIWVIQINPQRRRGEPREVGEILDRRNELSGNLSLNQELRFLKDVNKYLRRNEFRGTERKKPIGIFRIEMPDDLSDTLDVPSKLNRDPEFIRTLMARGEALAEEFLERRRGYRVRFERYPIEPCPPVLSAETATQVLRDWQALCARFARGTDTERRQVICEADRLLGRLMYERDYPVAHFRQRRRDVELEHPEVARRYALIHKLATDPTASGVRLAVAMVYGEGLLHELLGFAAYPQAAGPIAQMRRRERVIFRLDPTRSWLRYEPSGPQLERAKTWAIRLGWADVAQPNDPVALSGQGMHAGVLTREHLHGPPECRTAERFAAVLEALEAGNTYLEAERDTGMVRGQIC